MDLCFIKFRPLSNRIFLKRKKGQNFDLSFPFFPFYTALLRKKFPGVGKSQREPGKSAELSGDFSGKRKNLKISRNVRSRELTPQLSGALSGKLDGDAVKFSGERTVLMGGDPYREDITGY